MSFWGKGSPAATSNTPKIRVEKIAVVKLPKKPINKLSSPLNQAILTHSSSSRQTNGRTSSRAGSARVERHPSRSTARKSPAYRRIESDSSDDDDLALDDLPRKRLKESQTTVVDLRRNLSSQREFSNQDKAELIQAGDIASQALGFAPAFGLSEEDPVIFLQMPGSEICERFELVFRQECFDPVAEIIEVVKDFTEFYLPPGIAQSFLDPDSGIIRRLERARNLKSLPEFKNTISDYNSAVDNLRKEGTIAKILDEKHNVSYNLVRRIMKQTYDRAVSPKVDLLKKYKNGTDEIYGELNPNFVSAIFSETQITSDQVFVDLGSGVANVVLQAALQVGCESWGCEIMENACTLAEAHRAEFQARCRLWGIAPGEVNLERGDFMKNESIRETIKNADVVLVNNEVFTPALNNDLVNLFLDLKEGCKIVSLKSFVPVNHKIRSYNLNNPVNLLDVQRKSYSSESVSWKTDGGDYFIAIKDSRRLQMFEGLN